MGTTDRSSNKWSKRDPRAKQGFGWGKSMLKLHASVYPTTSYKIFVRHIAKSRIYLPDGPVNNNCINDYLVLPRLRCQDFSPHGHFAPWTLRFRSAIPGVRLTLSLTPKPGPWEWRTPGMGGRYRTLRPNWRRYLLPRELLQLPRLGRVG